MGRKKMTPEIPAEGSTDAVTPEAPKFNKSARIRELADLGRTAKEIKQSLDADGIETSLPTIYTVMNAYKKAKAGGAPDPKKGPKAKPTAAPAPQGHENNGRISVEDAQALVGIAWKNGGLDSAINVLQAMRKV
jgi:hypothetical protein